MKIDEKRVSLLDSFYMYLTHDKNNPEGEKFWIIKSSSETNGSPNVNFAFSSLSKIFRFFDERYSSEDLEYVENVYRNRLQEGETIRLKKDLQTGEYTINGCHTFKDFIAHVYELANNVKY